MTKKTNSKNILHILSGTLAVIIALTTFAFALPGNAGAPISNQVVVALAHRYDSGSGTVSDADLATRLVQARKLELFLDRFDGPLKEYSMVMVTEAAKYDNVPYWLMGALGALETQGCKDSETDFDNNCWGWGGAKYERPFDTMETAIAFITKHLAGEVDSTKRYYGKNKDGSDKSLRQKIQAYNSVNQKYWENLMWAQKKIESQDVPELNHLLVEAR